MAGGRFKSLRLLLALYPFVVCLGYFVVAIGFYSVMFGLDFSNVGTCGGRLRDLPGSDFRLAALFVQLLISLISCGHGRRLDRACPPFFFLR